jgi:hypothetical protein
VAKNGESKTSEKRISAIERQRQALELRSAGVGFADIAARLGYSGASGAYKAVWVALRRTLQEPADELRKLELKRCDDMHLALWMRARAGDEAAIDRVLRIMERRARYLGLDAPTRMSFDVDVSQLDDDQLRRIANGEDPTAVLAGARKGRAGTATAPGGEPGPGQ